MIQAGFDGQSIPREPWSDQVTCLKSFWGLKPRWHAIAAAAVIIGTTATLSPAAETKTAPLVAGPIVASGAKLEKLFDGGYWTEGPAVGPDGRIYFCDLTMTFATGMEAGNIWVYDPVTGQTTLYRSPSGMAAGIKFDHDGSMVVTEGADFGGRSVIRTDAKTGRSAILAGLYKGRPFNAPNDLDIDDKGRIYFTDPRYFGYETIEQPVSGVYRIDPDGSVHLILADIARPNGIALSPDQKTLYVAELDPLLSDWRIDKVPQASGAMRLLAYDLAADGSAGNQRVLVDYGKETGPDGIAVDSAGNIYAAVSAASRRGVRVYSPDGKEIAFVPVPDVSAVTNIALASEGSRTWLYITATKGLYRIETRIPARMR
ncbi:SMP-30/gluconolactonase/LRE family protein [Neorhizobium galegae]|uniref:SMP-30/gluconolactonase/LRE family protein n=1 Tax=Neorhizobium galegae TaxID=399 RepID=UPI00062137BB|nr:SMP-30/gluconolactonase/LRE family protein [Neorhizobium galegae]CDZ51737.1 Gluconolactonase [Neorhizobium galegae bv. orientalis]